MTTTGFALDKGVAASVSSKVTNTFQPTGNRLALLWVMSRRTAGSISTPTATGTTNTWTQIATRANGTSTRRGTLFRHLSASPASETVTIDFGGQTQDGMEWIAVEFSEVVTTGTNGSGAVVQSGTASGTTSISVTLAAFGDAVNNVAFLAAGSTAGGLNLTVTGYTELSSNVGSGNNPEGETDYFRGEDLSVDASHASATTIIGIAIEIDSTNVSGGGLPIPVAMAQYRQRWR